MLTAPADLPMRALLPRGAVGIDDRLPTQLAPADRTDVPADGAPRGRVVRTTRHPSRPGVVRLDRGGGGGRPVLLVVGGLPGAVDRGGGILLPAALAEHA